MVGRLLKDDDTPDIDAIKRLFDEVDVDKNSHISRSELEQIVKKIQFGKVIDADEANTKLYKYLDVDKDNEITEQEFVDGFIKLINSNSNHDDPSSSSSSHETN
ncbi:calcium-binding EF-hand protein, partial [Trifolium medium]|nr:calcium-binding EF-hand protein [Trifolium medium]